MGMVRKRITVVSILVGLVGRSSWLAIAGRNRSRMHSHTCISRGSSPRRVQSCACISHIAATAAAWQASPAWHPPPFQAAAASAACTHGSPSPDAMAPYSARTATHHSSHTASWLQPWRCLLLAPIGSTTSGLSTWGMGSRACHPEGSALP
jgi:hypothetical protein